MKHWIFFLLIVASIITLSSCGGSGNKLNEDESSASNNGKPSGTDAPNFKLDMSPQNVALGKATYLETCSPCHGVGGKGDGPASAALNPQAARSYERRVYG